MTDRLSAMAGACLAIDELRPAAPSALRLVERPDMPRMCGRASPRPIRSDGPRLSTMFADDVWRYSPIGPVPTLIAGIIGLGLVVYVTWVRSTRTRAITWALLGVCVLVILAMTGRGALGNVDGEFSWRLGESIGGELRNINRELGLLNLFGNVLMFVPVGWLTALLARGRGFVVGALSAVGLSIAIEIWQMLSGSFGDIDDVVLNAAGGLIGAVLATAIRAVRNHPRAAFADASVTDRVA